MARKRKSRRSRSNPVGFALNRRRRRSYRRNPVGIQSTLKKFFPLPSMPEVAALAGGSWAAGFVSPRVLAMVPMLAGNVFGRVVARLIVVSGLIMASNAVFRRQSNLAKMIGLGALANQVPHLTNDVLSLAKIKINFGENDDSDEPLALYYGEEPLMLGEESSAELGQDETSPEMGLGYYFGQPSAMIG